MPTPKGKFLAFSRREIFNTISHVEFEDHLTFVSLILIVKNHIISLNPSHSFGHIS
jgi:hypothetical protein